MRAIGKSTAKESYGEPTFNQTGVALDSFDMMMSFLNMEGPKEFTDSDRDAMVRDLETLAAGVAQMDSGQRGRGVSFDEIPHAMVRVCVGAMKMYLSGTLGWPRQRELMEAGR